MNAQTRCWTRCVETIKGDLCRYGNGTGLLAFVRHYVLNAGFRFSLYMRLWDEARRRPVGKYLLFPVYALYRHHAIKYGLDVLAEIGPGLHIGHTGGIVVSQYAKIGKNCNLSHQVTIGIKNRGKHKGAPEFGDNVYIGPGAKVIGGIKIGDFVAIGANAVVTSDVPDHAVVVGIPARVISYEGSTGYVNNTV